MDGLTIFKALAVLALLSLSLLATTLVVPSIGQAPLGAVLFAVFSTWIVLCRWWFRPLAKTKV
jgi:hypothetical protein